MAAPMRERDDRHLVKAHEPLLEIEFGNVDGALGTGPERWQSLCWTYRLNIAAFGKSWWQILQSDIFNPSVGNAICVVQGSRQVHLSTKRASVHSLGRRGSWRAPRNAA